KELSINKLNDFLITPNLQFGVIRSFKHGSDKLDLFIEELRKKNRIEESTNQKQIFLKLNKNYIQGFFTLFPVYKKYINEIDGLSINSKIIDVIPEENPAEFSIVLSKKVFNDEEFKKWKSIVQSIIKDGSLKKIFLKYFTNAEIDKYHLVPK
ncbi:MAG: hypothetical protein K2X69_15015, partial [Silvanigrellaceae bacterium]|nr:hypothetical protein [Silvanigrellaceae bacterium]